MTEVQQNVRPKYEIHPYTGPDVDKDGMVSREVYDYVAKKDDDGKVISRQFEKKVVKRPAGFMAYFPSGSSIRVEKEDELRRLELLGDSDLIDMETGEVVHKTEPTSLRDLSERKTKKSKRLNAKLESKDSIEDMVEEIVSDE